MVLPYKTPKRMLRQILVIGLIIISLFIVSVSNAQETSNSVQPSTTPLRWAPPELDNPIVVNINVSGNNTIKLDDRDYILNMPDTPVTEALRIQGGRNIVIIGGEIDIPYQGDNPTRSSRTGIKIIDSTGIVHIEGILIHGEDLSEGIQIDAPDAIVQIQNVRIEDIHARDQVNFTDNHPDLIQPYGNVIELRVDRFTGSTDYQGFMLKSDFNGSLGTVIISNANIIGRPTARYLIWFSNVPDAGDVTFENVYLDLPSGSHGSLGNAVWPHDRRSYPNQAQVINTSDCTCVTWPSEMSPNVTGYIREGTPPQGDYVQRDQVGIGYLPVGYGDGSGGENPMPVATIEPTVAIPIPVASIEPTYEPLPPNPNDQLAVNRLILVDADSNTDIGELSDGMQININDLPTTSLNIRAETNSLDVGSVSFALNGDTNYRTENVAPYALEGDSNGNYNSWHPSLGSYVLTATPYSNTGRNGMQGISLTINFEIVSGVNHSEENRIDAPTNLLAQALDSSQIELTWDDNANNETLYEIERNGISLRILAANSVIDTDTHLTADTNYCYRVRAVNDTGQSEWSNEICATTLAEQALLVAPTNLLAQTLDSTQIELTWDDNADSETLYEIERNGISLRILAANSVIDTDTNLTADTNYCYRVRAIDNLTESAWSNEVCATTLTEQVLVATPTNPIAQAVDGSEIELTWDDNADNETMFEIERDGLGVMVLPPDSTLYFDTDLTVETNYCYRVRAVSDAVQSSWSNEVCATTLADSADENQMPTLATPDEQSNTVGDAVNLQLTYNDPEDGILRFAATDLPDGLSIDATTGVITGAPISADTHTVTITAVDAKGLSTSASFGWTILPQEGGDNNPLNGITGLVLVDANTNQDIMELTDGVQLNLSSLPSTNLNIRAETTNDVESVRFGLNANSNFRNENVAPYALVGDNNGNYNAWSPSPGTYTIIATAYTEDNGGGATWAGQIVSFTVVSSTTIVPQPTTNPDSDEPVATPIPTNSTLAITTLILVDANSDQDIMVLTDGVEISLSSLPSANINVRAETTDDVESVRFGLNANSSFSLENVAPYALLGDNNGNYNAWAPSPGTYTLRVTPYSQSRGGGNTGIPLIVTITITP